MAFRAKLGGAFLLLPDERLNRLRGDRACDRLAADDN